MAAGPEVGDFTVAPTVIGIADGRGSIEPLVGVVEFRPRQDALPIPDGVGYTGPIVVELDGDGRIPGGTRVPGWTGSTCQVIPRVRRGERGRDLRIVPFDVPAEPGSTVFLSDHLTLWTDPSAGTVYVRGPRGEFAVEDREFFTSVRADVLGGAAEARDSASLSEGAAVTADEAAVASRAARAAAEAAVGTAQSAQAAASESAAHAASAEQSAASSASVAGSAATEAALSRDAAGGAATEAGRAATEAGSAAAEAALSRDAAAGLADAAAASTDAAASSAEAAASSAEAAAGSAAAAAAAETSVAGHVDAAAGAASDAQQSADAAGASASAADERAGDAQQSAAAAAAEHTALTDAIEAGEYRGAAGDDGVSVESITDDERTGTATIAYSDGSSAPLPLPEGLPGADSTVPGPPGAVPTAADFHLVGPGRPDAPDTTGGVVTPDAPVGALFVSTDGANISAWLWVNTPTGWILAASGGGLDVSSPTV